jgi:hypothetical protein
MIPDRPCAATRTRTAWIALATLALGCGGGGKEPDRVPTRQLAAFSSAIGFYYGPPTLAGGAVYVGTSRGLYYPVSPSNAFFKLTTALVKVWQYDLGSDEVRGAATLDSAGNVYFVVERGRRTGDVSSATQHLVSLDPGGRLRWSAQTAAAGTVSPIGMSCPAVSTADVVYVGGDRLHAFNQDGSVRWTWGADLRITNAPIIDDAGNLYFTARSVSDPGDARVVSLDPAGSVRWVYAAPTSWLETYSSPAFSADASKIYVGLGEEVHCLSAATGARLWSYAPGGASGTFRATPAVDAAGNVYVGTKGSQASVFYAIKADGSGLLWSSAVNADLYSSPALGSDGTVYVASEWRQADFTRLHALDMATGAIRWRASLPADATWSSPAIAADGTLYVATMAFEGGEVGAVVAFRTDSRGLLAGAGSARFHQGNASTGRR